MWMQWTRMLIGSLFLGLMGLPLAAWADSVTDLDWMNTYDEAGHAFLMMAAQEEEARSEDPVEGPLDRDIETDIPQGPLKPARQGMPEEIQFGL